MSKAALSLWREADRALAQAERMLAQARRCDGTAATLSELEAVVELLSRDAIAKAERAAALLGPWKQDDG